MKALICGGLVGLVFGVVAVMLPEGIGGVVVGLGTLAALYTANAVQHSADVERRRQYVSQFERK